MEILNHYRNKSQDTLGLLQLLWEVNIDELPYEAYPECKYHFKINHKNNYFSQYNLFYIN